MALASSIVKNPKHIKIESKSPTVDKIDQTLCYVDKEDKPALIKHLISRKFAKDSNAIALVFCRTKHGANRLAAKLSADIFNASVIHGNKSQSARKSALERFKSRESKVLIATDIAARGIDVKDMSLVINYELPEEPETYVHRIGRTARAEASGEAISFCSPEEVGLLAAIERFIKKPISDQEENPYHSLSAEELKRSGKKVPFVRKQSNPRRDDNSAGDSEKKTENRNSPRSQKPNFGSAKVKGGKVNLSLAEGKKRDNFKGEREQSSASKSNDRRQKNSRNQSNSNWDWRAARGKSKNEKRQLSQGKKFR